MTRRSDPRTARLPVPRSELPDFTPVPRQYERHDGWTPERQCAFIEALADTGSVAAACKVVDMSTVGAYYLRRQKGAESFRAAWQAALDLGVQRLEDVAMERALNGVEEPLYVYGNLVGTRRKVNDRLLMFMLRNRSPERFGASVNGGSLKGLNAVGKMEKRRLKKKWRAQWEKEWDKEQAAQRRNVSAADIRASIDRKVERIRAQVEAEKAREWAKLSEETRAAWNRYVELRDRDFDALKLDTEQRQQLLKGPDVNISYSQPDPPRKPPAPKEPKTWHSPKDDGWE
ncbi:hypothetical protein ACI5KX_07875 [Erythrobacter sp. GH1-10]|uniref:hypothetical protein n=1 Tax=Erythrobacter sp. GH1-10 TaxID=3349334 RepID=UPI003877D091